MDEQLIAERYRLDRLIGKGAVGQVWESFDTVLQRVVALKIVDLAATGDSTIPERFRREGIAVAGLDHPGVVKVYDTGVDDNKAYLVMELLSGPNLAQLVRDQGPVDASIGVQLLAGVADGLQAAHDIGITHRDVKPANIVLDAPPAADGTHVDLFERPELGRATLVDFGIARMINEASTQLTAASTAIGTAAYMSPEQAMGIDITTASDVYSLACVTYFLLTGRPPFTGDSSVAVAHAQVYDDPVPLIELVPSVPTALDDLVARMLAKEPKDRPTAHQVAAEFKAIHENPDILPGESGNLPAKKTVTSPTTGAPVPVETAALQSQQRSSRASQILLTALILVLLAGLILAWTRPRQIATPGPTITQTQTQVQTATVSVSAVPTEPASNAPATWATSVPAASTVTATQTVSAPTQQVPLPNDQATVIEPVPAPTTEPVVPNDGPAGNTTNPASQGSATLDESATATASSVASAG